MARPRQSACRHGHDFTAENTIEREYRGYVHRYCLACRRLRSDLFKQHWGEVA